MQSDAEKYLVARLAGILRGKLPERPIPPRILNIGAGRSLSIENQLQRARCRYICDRIDVDDCGVAHTAVDRCLRCSVESMPEVGSDEYTAAFANFVLEHVQDVGRAASEIHRILKPSGFFLATIPNPTSPLGLLTKGTPLWLRRILRREEAWETFYAYKTIDELIRVFHQAGFRVLETRYYSCLACYLHSLPILESLARLHDRMIMGLKVRRLMSHVCVVFEKVRGGRGVSQLS